MKLILDFIPLALFVGVYFYSGSETRMYPAVQALMVAVVIQNIGTRMITGKFEKVHLWTLAITLVLGSMTLIFRDPQFFQWKTSIVVWILAGVFIFRQLISNKLVIQEMLQAAIDDEMDVPEKVWKSINMVWPIGYIIFGIVNLLVAYQFEEAIWVKFKLFGLMALTICLFIYTIVRLMPYFAEAEDENNDGQSETLKDETKSKDSSVTSKAETKEI